MFLKNTSEKVIVIINTVAGKIPVKPLELVNIKHKILPPISKNIIEVTEEEYNNFRNPKQEIEEKDTKSDEQSSDTSGQDTKELDEFTEDIADSFLNKLLNFTSTVGEDDKEEEPKFEEVGEDAKVDSLKIELTDSSNELDSMEKQMEDLKKAWAEATTPRKKDKIHKQIKELQKQIDKINKDVKAE